jgi:hypothetical protein
VPCLFWLGSIVSSLVSHVGIQWALARFICSKIIVFSGNRSSVEIPVPLHFSSHASRRN